MKKLQTILSLLAAAGILLTACGGGNTQQAAVAQSNLRRETNPTIPDDDIKNLVDGNNAFALDIYQTLRSESGNLILSPFSISLALAMTYAGARGETETQMADVLHFTSQDKVHPAFNALDLALEKEPVNLDEEQEPLKLNVANAVWAEQTYPFLPEFLDIIAVNYGAGVQLADFINKPNEERLAINDWVSEQTEDRINDLLADGTITSYTRMVLVNAIYFKADWLRKFDPNTTYDAPFHLLDGSEVTSPMMNDAMHGIPYMLGDGYQAIELAYAGETAAMDIILPDEGNFEAFEAGFDKAKYDEIIQEMQVSSSVMVSLPKFEFTKDFSLADPLSTLGMGAAFDGATADFSGMTGNKDLFIADVIHKAFVAVDEAGTEAAAATAVIMEATSAPMYDAFFQADRPFIFIIRDTVNGQVLFMGRVLNPSE
jgi:serpin B